MTPDEVHDATFRRPRFGSRGYDEDQVDEVLDRIEATLRGEPQITRAELGRLDLRKPRFLRRGYREEDVEAFLRRVAAEWPSVRH
jgi:DivIVA domain-containing protein